MEGQRRRRKSEAANFYDACIMLRLVRWARRNCRPRYRGRNESRPNNDYVKDRELSARIASAKRAYWRASSRCWQRRKIPLEYLLLSSVLHGVNSVMRAAMALLTVEAEGSPAAACMRLGLSSRFQLCAFVCPHCNCSTCLRTAGNAVDEQRFQMLRLTLNGATAF